MQTNVSYLKNEKYGNKIYGFWGIILASYFPTNIKDVTEIIAKSRLFLV